jgi:hypothetical protein
MTPLQTLILFSAIFGAIGSALIFFGSYAFEPPRAAVWANQAMVDNDLKTVARNHTRKLMQRCGIALLFIAFILQGVSAFAPS